MAENKYGRLYTEDDMLAFAFLCSGEQPVTTRERLRKCETKFPADEPLFLLRAQDLHSSYAIEEYRDCCENDQRHGGAFVAASDQVDAIRAAHEAFTDWQEKHPERVKVPD